MPIEPLRRRRGVSRRPGHARDTDASFFSTILSDLVARVPGAVAAVLVDRDGEAVDYTGSLPPFELKLAGAHWQIVLRHLHASKPDEFARTLHVRGARRSFIAHALPDEYVLVLVLSRRAGFTAPSRAFSVCERLLAEEAGWRARPRSTWFPVEVVSSRGRPVRVTRNGRDYSVEVLGRHAGLGARERGWRVRIEMGAEITLVREPGDHWYADLSLDALFPSELAEPASPAASRAIDQKPAAKKPSPA